MGRVTNVVRTLKRTGTPVILRSVPVSGVYNPLTGGVITSPPTDDERYALLLDMLTSRPLVGFGKSTHLNTDVDGVKKWALLDADGCAPKVQDDLIDASSIYKILNVQTVSDASGAVLYVLALRN